MHHTRPAAVAGTFYPADPTLLGDTVEELIAAAVRGSPDPQPPKALIVPHAGYLYSGPVAASAYARLLPFQRHYRRVVLLGPAHRVALHGLALPQTEYFTTPLGPVRIDPQAAAELADLPQVSHRDDAHALEHSLETQLPFLQSVLDDFTLVPLVVGQASADEVAAVVERLWGDETTLIVVSTDLSHYHDYGSARLLDTATAAAIESLQGELLQPEMACGAYPLAGLLLAARRHGLYVETVDLRNSGDTAGSRDRVVGYGAWLLHPSEASAP